MRELIQQILDNDKIPSPPAVAARLLELAQKPDVDIDEITKALSADPKLAGKLIGYCNSPIVGSKREITSLQQAVMVLGMRTVRLLSLSFSLMDSKLSTGFDYDEFWRRSLAMAIASKLVHNEFGGNGDEAFMFGLVFNVGLIGIGNTFPELYAEIESQRSGEMPESEKLGQNRYQIGAQILNEWNFPESMVTALGEYDPSAEDKATKLKRASAGLCELMLSHELTKEEIRLAKQGTASLLEIDNEHFDELFDHFLTEWKGYESIFDYEAIPFGSIAELESTAKESMVMISLGMESEIKQITKEKEKLEESALIDPLTSLKNRRAYEAEVPGVVELHKRQKKSFGVIVIDIDHFKIVNDTHGHAVGDDVLKAVGKNLNDKCRAYDTVYRYGGEEFVAVVLDCDFESTKIVADRMRKNIEEMVIPTEVGDLKVTASLGVCWSQFCEFVSIDQIFLQADEYLYEAKHAGRNRCVMRPFREDAGVNEATAT